MEGSCYWVFGCGCICSANHGPLQLGCSSNRAADSRKLKLNQPKLGEHLGMTLSRAISSHVKRSMAVLKMFEKINIAAPCNISRIYCSTGYWGSYHLLTNLYEKGLEMQIASDSSSWKSSEFLWAINTVLDRGLSGSGLIMHIATLPAPCSSSAFP